MHQRGEQQRTQLPFCMGTLTSHWGPWLVNCHRTCVGQYLISGTIEEYTGWEIRRSVPGATLCKKWPLVHRLFPWTRGHFALARGHLLFTFTCHFINITYKGENKEWVAKSWFSKTKQNKKTKTHTHTKKKNAPSAPNVAEDLGPFWITRGWKIKKDIFWINEIYISFTEFCIIFFWVQEPGASSRTKVAPGYCKLWWNQGPFQSFWEPNSSCLPLISQSESITFLWWVIYLSTCFQEKLVFCASCRTIGVSWRNYNSSAPPC